jgi:hypothetical protein
MEILQRVKISLLLSVLIGVSINAFAGIETVAETISIAADNYALVITADYSGDDDSNSSMYVEWDLNGGDFSLGSETIPYMDSPYVYSIENLDVRKSYQVRITFLDDNNPGPSQTITDLAPNNPLVHNSISTGSDKWANGWGIEGGKYGRFNCNTCHVRRSGNIKRVRKQLSAPDTLDPFPIETDSLLVTFTRMTDGNSDFGNDEGGHTSSQMICEACHSTTEYHRYDTGDQSSFSHFNKSDCIRCHPHKNGFGHGQGTGCGDCHGKDDDNGGVGSTLSHSTHTESDADDARGPQLSCDTCHQTSDFPYFKSGTDDNGDGVIDLSETDVCDTCHSPEGSYDGVNDLVVGAKTNWDAGVYSGVALRPGKEKWCSTCHDESPSQITGINAPNVIGDEDGSYIYGIGWGYYKTGHGLTAEETYPSKGGIESLSGRAVECDSCHDYATAHVDGEARTYDDGDSTTTDSSVYRQGYRLKLIDGQEPYRMPRPSNIGNSSDQFRVCFQIGCHDSSPFTDSANMNTNMMTDGTNRHAYHLNSNNQTLVAADWSGANNSRITCIVCHNVHGSTRLAMVRDGKLIGREPGLQIWYKNDATTHVTANTSNPPEPEDLPLPASDGTAWIGESSTNLCAHCHGNTSVLTEDRLPFQEAALAPLLEWVGSNGLTSDGVDPDSAVGNSTFTFRVAYIDINNDSPSSIEVWVDQNDNGSYDAGEKYAMAETENTDTNLFNGKIYTKSLSIAKAGDSLLSYRFYAHDGTLEATGAPTDDSSVTILNTAPILNWTGEDFYQNDGTNPDTGGNGGTFTFRIDYADTDDETPSTIQLWIDENDDGSYAVSEKYALPEVDSGDPTSSDGKLYARSLSLSHAGDGDLKYRFYATDANDDATGSPTQDSVLTVQAGANSPPSLEFVTLDCAVNGVKPQVGATGADFIFTVSYTDMEEQCPPGASDIQLWVDENDNLAYEASEQYDLTAVDAEDTTCNDGKLYSTSRVLTLAGDNALNYRFYATDGTDTAGGEAANEQSVTVSDALKVHPAGGSGWYSTIQSAIDAVDGAHTVLVYEGTYNEDILFEYGNNDSNTTLSSVCGPVKTIIDGSGSDTTVTFSRFSKSQIDGFQVTGGTTGIAVNGTEVTINNCQVHDNNGLNGGGIAVVQSGDMPTLTLTNSEIYNNTSDRGGGVRISRGTGHLISNSIIRNNTVTGESMADGGGGIHLAQIGDEITISNSVIKDNVSTNTYSGGGLYVSQVPDTAGAGLTVSDSIISGNTTGGQGGGIFSDASKINFVRSSITSNIAAAAGGALAHPSAGVTTSFENCVIADNQAELAGMAKLNGGTLNIINSTIANNQAATHSGVFYNQLATITIRNSILWGNHAATSNHIASFNGGSMTITDSIIQSGDDGNFINAPFFGGNVTPVVSGFASENDPWFVGNGDYHIKNSSPAIDNASATYAPADDIDGETRPSGVAPDIGADEVSTSFYSAPSLSWTGETNYNSDGVDPDAGLSGTSFTFNIDYTDADNDEPALMQLWINENGDGTYSAEEKFDLIAVDSGDTTYTVGKRYTLTKALSYAGDGNLNFRFYATDGFYEATGAPVAEQAVAVTNNVPALSWTGETNYAGDGVNPDSAAGGSSYEFQIDYTDLDNIAPAAIQVWIDEDASNTYEAGEKHDMSAVDGDSDYTDGKRYIYSSALQFFGNSNISYRFYAADELDAATGAPTSDAIATIINNAPTLAWTGEANYLTDGVNPDSADAGDIFTFRVDYTDGDNTLPGSIQLWVDLDDSSSYEEIEKLDLTETDALDTDYTDGKRYSLDKVLAYTGDGTYSYTFYATDGTIDASGDPTSDQVVMVADVFNNAPVLAWTSADCLAEGVRPPNGADGTAFEFMVSYSDADDQCADTIQLWIDENDNSSYEASEKYDLTEVDAGDINCSDSKLYHGTQALATTGDSLFDYRFFASDGVDVASGVPTFDANVGVYAATVVRPAGSAITYDYTSVIAAANAVSGKTLVYPNDDFTVATYTDSITLYDKDNRTIQSACGPDFTIISTSGTAITAQDSANLVVDGFSITTTDSGYGININRVDSSVNTFRNNKIYGNTRGVYVNDGDDVPVKLDNVEIYSNSVNGIYLVNADDDVNIINSEIHSHNVSGNGAAISGGNGNSITLTNSIIRNNTTTAFGGAIHINAAGANLTIDNSTIYENQAATGGAINMTIGSYANISRSTIRDNIATGQGGAIYTNAANLDLTNAIVADNHSGSNGGAISTNSGPTINIINTTLADNTATGSGGILYYCTPGTTTIRNSVLWGNTATKGANFYKACGGSTDYLTISDSDADLTSPTYAGGKSLTGSGTMLNLDPRFVDSSADNYHLQAVSPVLDQASGAYAPEDDIDGDIRPQGDGIDMGADEYLP